MSTPGKTRVAVVFGGQSTEHAVDQVTAGDLAGAIDADEFEIVPVGITRDGRWVLPARHGAALDAGLDAGLDADPDAGLDAGLDAERHGRGAVLPHSGGVEVVDPGRGLRGLAGVDVVFPLLRGVFGDEGTVQGLLEMADLPYVGSGVFASSVAMDHEFARKLFAAEGIPVVPHAVLREGESLTESDRRRLGLPLSVKPARSSGGSHATRVDEWSRLEEAVADAGEGKVLVEALPPGWSVVVGVLEGERDGVPQSSAPIRLPEADPESVADEDQNEPTPNGLHRDVAVKLEDYAVRAFAALDCAGLARVDFLVTVEHEIYLRGVDTMPSLSPRSPFVRAWTARGIEYPKLVSRLIRTAVRRGTGLH